MKAAYQMQAVSYTHLDVYKRQGNVLHCSAGIYHLLEYPADAQASSLTLKQFLEHLEASGEKGVGALKSLLFEEEPEKGEMTRVFEANTYTGNPIFIQVWGKRLYDAKGDVYKRQALYGSAARKHPFR